MNRLQRQDNGAEQEVPRTQGLAALLTHGLQVDVDEVEAIVLQGVMRLGRDVQVAVALLVAQVHLDP